LIVIRKNAKLRAKQYTGDNRDEIIRFLGITPNNCERWNNSDTGVNYLIISAPGIYLSKVFVKHWILIGENSLETCTPEDFLSNFEEVKK